ncbi:MAG: glycosyltransferase [Verrucomicrobiota bacterium]|nr:glycosyltransferase [Verrucomicrobiota bacterium]
MKIAVLIPCYNEELTVARVVQDFRSELPDAEIIVYDNNSTDRTAEIARQNGAVVRAVARRGKGAVVRAMFRDADADICVMVDGDDTYPATAARDLVDAVASGRADMAVGNRHAGGDYERTSARRFHSLGNALVIRLINLLFKCRLADIMSGYRAFSRLFVRNCPILTDGFEVETVMTLHALDKKFRIVEIPIEYRDRPKDSESKLSTFPDGFRVLKTILWVFKDCKPLLFFSILSGVSFLASLAVGAPAVIEFMETRYVFHVPSAILASGLAVISILLMACGFILDTIVKNHSEDFEAQLLKQLEAERKPGG